MIGTKKITKIIQRVSIKDEVFHKELYHIILPKLEYYTKSIICLNYGPVGYSSIPKNEDDL
jgi:hypothetical protein